MRGQTEKNTGWERRGRAALLGVPLPVLQGVRLTPCGGRRSRLVGVITPPFPSLKPGWNQEIGDF